MKPIEIETSQGRPKENADDGKHGSHNLNDNAASVENSDKPKPVEEHIQGAHQTINESFLKEGDSSNYMENLDEKSLDMRSDIGREIDGVSHESLVSDAEWVCENPSGDLSSKSSGWPSFNTKPSSHTCSLSAEEQATVTVLHLQHKALEACQEFLVGNAGSDCDEDDNHDEDEDELVDNYDSEECEEFKFFLRVFAEDNDLRKYYENNYREGDFYCLVCGGIGKKVWKRFKDCIALIHHSTAILRTKRKRAHRAYAKVIFKVVGWDIDQLPAIVLKGLGSSITSARKLLVEPEKSTDSRIDDSSVGSAGKLNSDF